MSLFLLSRRSSPHIFPVQRWELFWEEALRTFPKHSALWKRLSELKTGDIDWVCSDESMKYALSHCKDVPGFRGDDDYGAPISVTQLSPQEERDVLKGAGKEMEIALGPDTLCPLNAPRKARREAEKAFRKLQKQRIARRV